jgi:hypothetical protein
MVKREVIPKLDEVNKALEVVSSSSDSSSEDRSECVRQLSALASDLEAAHKDGKKLLQEAMQARSADKPEVCRSKCLQIVHSAYADPETKIYAYNILATQASMGQYEHFLSASTALVKEHIKEEGERFQMLGVISMLRESAREREKCCKEGKHAGTSREAENAGK